MHGIAVYVKEGLLFAQDLSLENSADSYLCFPLALLHSVLLLFPVLITFFIAKHLIYPRLWTEFGILVFFTNVSLTEFQGQIFSVIFLFSVIGSFELFWMGKLHKNIQLMLVFLKGLFFGPTLFLLYINDLPDDVICNIAIYGDN